MISTAHDPRHSLHFDLVTAGHEFLLAALPLRQPESNVALAEFVAIVPERGLPRTAVDAVLLRILTVLQRHAAGALPTLVERYLALETEIPDVAARFKRCVDELLAHRAVRGRTVRRAIECIDAHFADPHLSQRSVARTLGLTRAHLSLVFNKKMAIRFREYLKRVRLDAAVALLAATQKTIKEIWASVGYNYASDFDHDFKARFGMTPSEYRARVVASPAPSPLPTAEPRRPPRLTQIPRPAPRDSRSGDPPTVLIVDDCESTRETIGSFLKTIGYRVEGAATAEYGLQVAAQIAPNVIVLDYRLPDLDGIACLQRLRAQPGGRIPAVIMFTADFEIEDRAEEVRSLRSSIVSKLTDLDASGSVVASACAASMEPNLP